jgi:hypothetical protein
MKPRFKLNTDGSVTLLRAGLSGLSTHQIRQYMVACSGSVKQHCERFGLNTEGVRRALSETSTFRFDSAGAMRVALGLPMVPGPTLKFTENKRNPITAHCFALLMDGHAWQYYPELTAKLGYVERQGAAA